MPGGANYGFLREHDYENLEQHQNLNEMHR